MDRYNIREELCPLFSIEYTSWGDTLAVLVSQVKYDGTAVAE